MKEASEELGPSGRLATPIPQPSPLNGSGIFNTGSPDVKGALDHLESFESFASGENNYSDPSLLDFGLPDLDFSPEGGHTFFLSNDDDDDDAKDSLAFTSRLELGTLESPAHSEMLDVFSDSFLSDSFLSQPIGLGNPSTSDGADVASTTCIPVFPVLTIEEREEAADFDYLLNQLHSSIPFPPIDAVISKGTSGGTISNGDDIVLLNSSDVELGENGITAATLDQQLLSCRVNGVTGDEAISPSFLITPTSSPLHQSPQRVGKSPQGAGKSPQGAGKSPQGAGKPEETTAQYEMVARVDDDALAECMLTSGLVPSLSDTDNSLIQAISDPFTVGGLPSSLSIHDFTMIYSHTESTSINQPMDASLVKDLSLPLVPSLSAPTTGSLSGLSSSVSEGDHTYALTPHTLVNTATLTVSSAWDNTGAPTRPTTPSPLNEFEVSFVAASPSDLVTKVKVTRDERKVKRRIKNNEASKVCRASRKHRYGNMGEKIADLEERNNRLRETNAAQEKVNGELKEMMTKTLRWLKDRKEGTD